MGRWGPLFMGWVVMGEVVQGWFCFLIWERVCDMVLNLVCCGRVL